MTTWLIITIAIMLSAAWGGFWWRIRGGAWETFLRLPPGGQKARIVPACMISLCVVLWTWNPWFLILTLTLFLGMATATWGPHMVQDDRFPFWTQMKFMVYMMGWGVVCHAYSAVFLVWYLGTFWVLLPLIVSAMCMGMFYWLCWRTWWPQPYVPRLLDEPLAWAEFYAGAFIQVALLLAVMLFA